MTVTPHNGKEEDFQLVLSLKNKQGATQFYSLLAFSPSKNEAVERGYLVGRYGAIPFVSEPRWQNG